MISMNNKNPQAIVTELLKKNSNPVISNLVTMVQKGDSKGVENFARNLFKEKGRDFDKEFAEFKNNFKGINI